MADAGKAGFRTDTGTAGAQTDTKFGVEAPQLSLPKGGGAIRGIGEKFTANPATGTGSITIPLNISAGRSGFNPNLTLSYDSGAGNGPYGFGWRLSLPFITRKTDKGLPLYSDLNESDTFILSGAEDLVPLLVNNAGSWERDSFTRTVYGVSFRIHRYRPRVEGLFARIERWVNQSDPGETFFRSISRDNVTSWYGKTAESRIANPADPSHVFTWFICESSDDKGNVISYRYKSEDGAGVDMSQANERNRTDAVRGTNRYLKRALYGNRTPYLPDLSGVAPVALPTDWCFELVLDYGEHDELVPVPQDTAAPWTCRADAFSTYRATFEIRTYRLCRRALMFHHFANEPEVGLNCLVRSTDFQHSVAIQPPPHHAKPFYSFLLSVTQSGYRRAAAGYLSRALPPLEFAYSQAVIDETVMDVDAESLLNLPAGLDAPRYQWVDLDGEGLSGVLTQQADSFFYKPNFSPANLHTENGVEKAAARFGAIKTVASRPSLADLGPGRQRLLDIVGDGHIRLVDFAGPNPGFFERTDDEHWARFTPFQSLPQLDWNDPNIKMIDLTGDGRSDVLISEEASFRWYLSLAAIGFDSAEIVPQTFDEEKGPRLIFATESESLVLADLSGDGLTDLVRIRNGECCYWPNLGYGRFGAKVTMDQSPWFEAPGLFDARRVRFADIDGSGTSDIVYFASDGVQIYLNQSGSAWGARVALSHFPHVDTLSTATAIDLLGNGTSCLVWSSPLEGNVRQPMRYIDLMGGQKPHLLVKVTNNLGAETRIQYAPSTKFYVTDKLAGTPWLTRIPFPLQVVERIDTYDYVSRNRFVTRYAYHHGYFDGAEREFRGFGRVDQWDSEEFATLSGNATVPQATNIDAASHVPPVLTKTWFHTGVYFGSRRISKLFGQEYYREGQSGTTGSGLSDPQFEAMLREDTVLPTDIRLPNGNRIPYVLSTEEARQACRALRGSILRQETYAEDSLEASGRPYSVSERNYTIEVVQPLGPNRYAGFFSHPREKVDFQYERKLFTIAGGTLVDPAASPSGAYVAADPRVGHTITLEVDSFGNELRSVAVGYGRRYLDPSLDASGQTRQGEVLSVHSENSYTNAILDDDAYRAPLVAEARKYELVQVRPDGIQPGLTNLFGFDELSTKVASASDGNHDLQFEETGATNLTAGQPYRRWIECMRTLYRPDDMGQGAGDSRTLLPLGTLESLALPGNGYKLALTPGLLALVYKRGATNLLPAPAAVLGSVAADGGGYVDMDGDGRWWTPSGRIFQTPAPGTPAQEVAQARQHFFLPRRFEDRFGKVTTVTYEDPHDLLVSTTVDAATNTTVAKNDYRVLAASQLTDPNGNRSVASFDALGLVVGTALMGKAIEQIGDLLTGAPDLSQQEIDDYYGAVDPHPLAALLLGLATTRTIYDPNRFFRTRMAAPNDPAQWSPAFVSTVARETHVSDLNVAANQQSLLQLGFTYSDGFGREIQKKIQAEPGPIVDGGPTVDPRWVGSGWTIFNNKGKPVRNYEPFFQQRPTKGHQFEFGVQVGVSPILCYDPAERVVATLHPNHTFEKVVFGPWHQQTWDVTDTCLEVDPTTDRDVGEFFKRIPTADFAPSWYSRRAGGFLGLEEQAAASKASFHADTPSTAYFDGLGRTIVSVADNAADGKYATTVDLDIKGNRRSVTDAMQRTVVTYDYDLLNTPLHHLSLEAGERWLLNDAGGKAIRQWDSRGHNLARGYDGLRRAITVTVRGTDPNNSDPRTLNRDVLVEITTYGEGVANDQALNVRTRVLQHRDMGGVNLFMGLNPATNRDEAYDFKGNLLRSSRQLVADHTILPDWSAPPVLAAEVMTTTALYDALNRVIVGTTPDGSATHRTYNPANLLERIDIKLRGSAAQTSFIAKVDYNAKGQTLLVEYGNNSATSYKYDPATFRVTRLTTTRAGHPISESVVQDLSYTYDPVGNITHIRDDSDIQNLVFFRNQRVDPSADYTYDAIYRLTSAVGREHLGQTGNGQPLPPSPTTYDDRLRVGILPPWDGKAMGMYTERYQYDSAGNLLHLVHRGTSPASPGWSRDYVYGEPSLINPAIPSNRLSQTVLNAGGVQQQHENYAYDLHGNVTQMPQLQSLNWDLFDQLHITRRQSVNASDVNGLLHRGERTYHLYEAGGVRVRKVTELQTGALKNERMYLGSWELYREYTGGAVTLERETLHVMDGTRRFALVDTTTLDATAPPAALPKTSTTYQFSNHLESAVLELDDNASVISYEEYFPYGGTSYQALRSQVETPKRYRNTAKERDEETGFYYHQHRFYASWLGRWTSCDPSGIKDGVNLYSYGRGSPIRLLDPSGTQSQESQDVPLAPTDTRSADQQFAARFAGALGDFKLHLNDATAPTNIPPWLHPDPLAPSALPALPNLTPNLEPLAGRTSSGPGVKVTGGLLLPYLQIDSATLRFRAEAGFGSASLTLMGQEGQPNLTSAFVLKYDYKVLSLSILSRSTGFTFGVDPGTGSMSYGIQQSLLGGGRLTASVTSPPIAPGAANIAAGFSWSLRGGPNLLRGIGGTKGDPGAAFPQLLGPNPGGPGLSSRDIGDPFRAAERGIERSLPDALNTLGSPERVPAFITEHRGDLGAIGPAVTDYKSLSDARGPTVRPQPLDIRLGVGFEAGPQIGWRAWAGLQIVGF